MSDDDNHESNDEFLERILSGTDFGKEDDLLEPLLPEIDLIVDQGIMMFVRSVLLKAPENFWTDPSSFSGNYHPPDERDEGGGILHVKRVVRLVYEMACAQERTQEEKDVLVAAAILHDITKGAPSPDGDVHYDPMHPYTVESFIDWVRAEDKKYGNESGSTTLMIDGESLVHILRLIRCHMGVYSIVPETVPVTTLEWMLHLADLIASKLHYMIDGEEVQEWRWSV